MNLVFLALSFSVLAQNVCPRPSGSRIDKRQDFYFALKWCCEGMGATWTGINNFRARRRNGQVAIPGGSNIAWERSNSDEQYPLPKGPVKIHKIHSHTRNPMAKESSLPRFPEPKLPITLSRPPSPASEGPSSRPPSPVLPTTSQSPDEGLHEWHDIIGPLFIEGGNVAQWIMFKKQVPVAQQTMDRDQSVSSLDSASTSKSVNSNRALDNKSLAAILPRNDDPIFSLDYYNVGSSCKWSDVVNPMLSEDGSSVHWFRIKNYLDPGKENPELGENDFSYFVKKSKIYRQKVQ